MGIETFAPARAETAPVRRIDDLAHDDSSYVDDTAALAAKARARVDGEPVPCVTELIPEARRLGLARIDAVDRTRRLLDAAERRVLLELARACAGDG